LESTACYTIIALILILVKYFLYIILDIIKAIEIVIERQKEKIRFNIIELLFLFSELDNKLY
jgi:hypothetical protein